MGFFDTVFFFFSGFVSLSGQYSTTVVHGWERKGVFVEME